LAIAGAAGRRVFVSYRRQLSWQLAELVRKNLVEHDFDVFMDHKNLDSGEFDRRILSEIEARAHFIVLLEAGSLDRIDENGDWLRREIAHAIAHSRNVVPVFAEGFKFRRDLVLPPEVAKLPSFNGVAVAAQPEYFNAAMKRLRTRFLKKPPKPAALPLTPQRPASVGHAGVGPSSEASSAGAPVLPAPHLTGLRRLGGLGTLRPEVQLTWSEVPGADEYRLEREFRLERQVRGGLQRFEEVYRGPRRSYKDTYDVLASAVVGWRYRVCACASGQKGRWSNAFELDRPGRRK